MDKPKFNKSQQQYFLAIRAKLLSKLDQVDATLKKMGAGLDDLDKEELEDEADTLLAVGAQILLLDEYFIIN